jgi:hypothetical protein
MLDFWSIIHFGFWAFVSSTVAAVCEPPLWVHLTYTFVFGYVWEIFEHWASRKWPKIWSNRLEHWSNAWIGDPICNLSGSLFGWFVVYYHQHM